MPLIPFGEYRPDVTDYDQSFTGAVLNALPRGDVSLLKNKLKAVGWGQGGACRLAKVRNHGARRS